MRLLRHAILACVLAIGVGSMVSGQQQQRPANQDDLLAELRGLRADMNRLAQNTIRVQLVTARLTLQEGRLGRLSQQLNDVHQQLSQSQLTLAPFTLQLKQAQESNSEIFAPFRNMMEQVQKRDGELLAQETELNRLITSEENRGMDFNSRLDEIERALLAAPGR
jgi:chromosome segregation ATPase